IVGVRKRRQTRGFGEHILVEIAEILAVTRDDRSLPVDPSLMSVAVKSRLDLGSASRSGIAAARDELRTVLEKPGGPPEGLTPRNDLEAIASWSRDPSLVATGAAH